MSKTEELNSYEHGGNHYMNHSFVCPHCNKKIDPWDFYGMMPFLVANVIKYVIRYNFKNGKDDLVKAKHYLEKLIAVCYPEQ